MLCVEICTTLVECCDRGATDVFIWSVEESPSFVPVVWSAGVVVDVTSVSLADCRVELVDGVCDHPKVCG